MQRMAIRYFGVDIAHPLISAVLRKLKGATVIVTEYTLTSRSAKWNKDKVAGPDIRLFRHFGVFLEHPPLSLHLETLLEVQQPFNGVDTIFIPA